MLNQETMGRKPCTYNTWKYLWVFYALKYYTVHNCKWTIAPRVAKYYLTCEISSEMRRWGVGTSLHSNGRGRTTARGARPRAMWLWVVGTLRLCSGRERTPASGTHSRALIDWDISVIGLSVVNLLRHGMLTPDAHEFCGPYTFIDVDFENIHQIY